MEFSRQEYWSGLSFPTPEDLPNPSLGGVCNFLGSVSPQQKFEVMDGPSVIVQFYLASKGKYTLEAWGRVDPKMRREECPTAWRRERVREKELACGGERKKALWLRLLYVFFPPPGPTLYKLGLARSAICSPWGLHWVLGPQTFLCSIFVGFSLPCLLATAVLDSCFLF